MKGQFEGIFVVCRLWSICCAYAGYGLLFWCIVYIPGSVVWGSVWFEPIKIICKCCMFVSRFRFCHTGFGIVFLLTGLVSCENVLLHSNAIFTSIFFQTFKEFANIKLQTQIFTTSTMVQFCVNKYPPLVLRHSLQYSWFVTMCMWYILRIRC